MSILNPANPLKSGGSSSDSGVNQEAYSYDEVRIGTWVDGKPLYRKVINTTSPSKANAWIQIAEVKQVDTFVSIQGTLVLGTLDRQVIPNPKTYLGIRDVKNPCMYTTASSETSKPVLLIVEYTKTTD